MAWITMINSVGEHVAGEKIQVSAEIADRYILRGYAEGTLSREYSDEEKAAVHADHQEVTV